MVRDRIRPLWSHFDAQTNRVRICVHSCQTILCSLYATLASRRICQDIFLKLYKNGWLEEHENQQLYCETDKRFLADRYVEGICPKCKYDVS